MIHNTWYQSNRLPGLRRFALAITLLNVLGHTLFGFEQSWAQPLVALATAYSLEILFEIVDARINRRVPRFMGRLPIPVDFLLPAHISALAVSMLMYANERLLPFAFAAAAAIASKAVFHVPPGKGPRHFLNPSNFGISLTLLLFPWVGISPPYHFTENLSGAGDWILPGIIIVSGTFLNARFTQRLPLMGAWLSGFALQALIRSLFFDTPVLAAWLPMTGVAFILFTCYMITDPGTTPNGVHAQMAFGAAVALAYGFLMTVHVVFGLFFSLTIVCALRGCAIHANAWIQHRRGVGVKMPTRAVLQRPAP